MSERITAKERVIVVVLNAAIVGGLIWFGVEVIRLWVTLFR